MWNQNLTFTCFACAGVTEKYSGLNIGDDIPLFVDKNVKDIKNAHAVDSDEKAHFGPDYKRVKTTAPSPPPPPPLPPPQPPAAVARTGQRRPSRRAKRVPKPTLLEKALAMLALVQSGKEQLELLSQTIEAEMDSKLADLLFQVYVAEHPNVVSVELQVLS